MEFTLIPDLVPQNRHVVIKMYVSRKWIFRGAMDNGPIHHIDLVLIDKEGNGISAEIPGNLAEEKGSIIEENEIYEISRFTISSARQMFKPVHIDKMIHFTYHTIIKASLDSPSTFPRYVYHLTPLHQIESYIQKNEYFLDATATTQMFCFDTVARHIVGRPCETVLKQDTEAAPIPPDLAQIVSLKFTFCVTASNQTFAQQEKQPTVLQINSIVVVHGRQHSLSSGIQNTIDQGPSTPNKEATLKLLKESPSTAMERLSTKVSKDVGRKLTYSTQDEDFIGSQVLDVAQGTNADKGIPTDKGKEIEPHLQSPPKR
ncbi:hypothetical protein Zm00014a_023274 [Zea mays]|uniref:Replication protein A 70 kDa DNA-binding subunit B/D first OB fold domain-containing protein n=1 Tax=Zea mays TaxID=4577 RepID=A0A317Y7V2_MAIZE|nr:hypothetical protein Zm00014a_023274 [Zea mays]